MKISEDVLKSKGIPYVQKYPYSTLSKTSKNGKRHLILIQRNTNLEKKEKSKLQIVEKKMIKILRQVFEKRFQ